MAIVTLEQCNEAQIRDYFALATMYLYYGLPSKAEYVLRRTVKLCSESVARTLHAKTLMYLELLWESFKYISTKVQECIIDQESDTQS